MFGKESYSKEYGAWRIRKTEKLRGVQFSNCFKSGARRENAWSGKTELTDNQTSAPASQSLRHTFQVN